MPKQADEQVETNENQAEEVNEEQVETNEQEALSEEEQVEQVKKLLDSQEKETNEEESEEESEEELQVEKPEEQPQNIVTDEMIAKYPTLRTFRGKRFEEILPGYDKLVRNYTKESQKVRELQKQLEKNSLTQIGEPPDPIENREEFDKWLKRRDELITSQAKAEPEEAQTDYLPTVQARLPEGVDAQVVADEWTKFNARRLFDETGNLRPKLQELYKENPDILIDEIVDFYELASKANQNEMMIKKSAKETAYKETKQAFRNAQKTKKESSQVKTVPKSSDLTEEDKLLLSVMEIVKEEE